MKDFRITLVCSCGEAGTHLLNNTTICGNFSETQPSKISFILFWVGSHFLYGNVIHQ